MNAVRLPLCLNSMLTLYSFSLAGSDTTAISLRAILYYLVKTPTSFKRLQEEIDAADRAGKLSEFVSYGESLELEYL